MTGMAFRAAFLLAVALEAQEPRRITVLYDAFGVPSDLKRDWGFAALVEYGGKRILFHTGNDAAIFERNVKALGTDLTKLDGVFISHRHGDHTTGLGYLLEVNPGVRIFAPQEGAFFKSIPPKKKLLAPYPD
ncbi:MAG: MBL fold metallo-hydrolase, partial [Vicinamibacteria bacterium]